MTSSTKVSFQYENIKEEISVNKSHLKEEEIRCSEDVGIRVQTKRTLYK